MQTVKTQSFFSFSSLMVLVNFKNAAASQKHQTASPFFVLLIAFFFFLFFQRCRCVGVRNVQCNTCRTFVQVEKKQQAWQPCASSVYI